MIGKFLVTFIGKGEPSAKKKSIEYSFITGTVDEKTKLFGGQLNLINAWTTEDLNLAPFKSYSGLVNVSQMGDGLQLRLQSLETDKGSHKFYDSKEAAALEAAEA